VVSVFFRSAKGPRTLTTQRLPAATTLPAGTAAGSHLPDITFRMLDLKYHTVPAEHKQTEPADGAGSAPRVSPGEASDGKVKVYLNFDNVMRHISFLRNAYHLFRTLPSVQKDHRPVSVVLTRAIWSLTLCCSSFVHCET
jgi:hypothetical protein